LHGLICGCHAKDSIVKVEGKLLGPGEDTVVASGLENRRGAKLAFRSICFFSCDFIILNFLSSSSTASKENHI
jgi:hypothetical protein